MGSIQPEPVGFDNGRMEPMAIIGMATRFPQEATNNENLWKFLLQARQAMTPFPKERVNADAHYHPDQEHGGTFHVKGGHFLAEPPESFDAPFFSVTKTEVLTLDPQQRLLMENVYHALENAGIPMSTATSSKTSVFVSGFNHDHLSLLNTDPETALKYKPTGTSNSLLANRVSWFYDFKAPSITIDTACSSSMVGLHLACQSLNAGESTMAVVSGVGVLSFPTDVIGLSHHGFLSPDGKCFSFDHRANGYSRGEGVGTIVVKRLSAAIRDGDTIRAVIRGTGVNQDGRTAGVTLPSAAAQETLMRDVYANASLDVKDTHYVEAHGTGTSAGDPIEASAVANIFRTRDPEIPLFIGAIKSGIGHLEGGSGTAGIIKSIMILESGIIPPNVNFEKVNPKIPVEKWNIKFPLENIPWPKPGVRRISINSFGVGGTNAHAILDDAYHYLSSHGLSARHYTSPTNPTPEAIQDLVARVNQVSKEAAINGAPENGGSSAEHQNGDITNGTSEDVTPVNGVHQKELVQNGDQRPGLEVPRLIVFSSFDEQGIQRSTETLAMFLREKISLEETINASYIDDLTYTMSNKRTKFPWRSYCLANTLEYLPLTLTEKDAVSKPVRTRTTPKVAFVFTGQGAQWFAMGRELLVYPLYKQSLEEASAYMKTLGATWSLTDELLRDKSSTLINDPTLSHPALTALQVALVDLLASWAILPSRVVGHSSGEIAAAYCAGKLRREAAWKVAYYRGHVSAKRLSAKGAMMAVGLSETALKPYMDAVNAEIQGEIIIACFNSPKNNTISGDEAKIDALKRMLDVDGVFTRKLNVQNAYHSAHMREVADEYLSLLGDLESDTGSAISKVVNGTKALLGMGERIANGWHDSARPEVHLFSTVTGKRIEEAALPAEYWMKNMVSPVRFTDGLSSMCFSRLSSGQASLRMNATAQNVFADDIVEIGPHGALKSAIKDVLASKVGSSTVSYHNVLDRSSPGLEAILNAAGQLYSKGFPVEIAALNTSYEQSKQTPRLLVDLPPYSFNHSDTAWYESRLSKNFRQRKYPRHDLFGAPVSDWSEDAPRWRHFLRLSENPWLRDHMVTDSYVFPGVGYLVMAIEASRQMADKSSEITGFRLRDVSLKRALLIPDTKDGIETSLSLTRMDESSLSVSSVWSKFQVSSYNPIGDDWIEHCTGYITVDYKSTPGPIDNGREAEAEALAWKDSAQELSGRCEVSLDIESTYDNLQTAGLNFGPTFRNLTDVKGTGKGLGEVTGIVTTPDVAATMPKTYLHSHLIHPCTMDSFLHFFLASLIDLGGKDTLERAMVPTFIKDIWVSANINAEPYHAFRGHGKSSMIAYEKHESDILIWDDITNEGLVSIKGLRATPVTSVEAAGNEKRKLCHQLLWKPDVDLVTPTAFTDVVKLKDGETYKYWINRLQLATMLLITDALEELKDIKHESLEGHFLRYYEWMRYQADNLHNDAISHLPLAQWKEYSGNKELKGKLYHEVEQHNADGALAVRMGSNIPKVLRKEVDPMHLMFGQDDLLDHVYRQVVKLGDIPANLDAYLKVVSHSYTNISIFEAGAGTGSSTSAILDILSPAVPEEDEASAAARPSEVIKYTFTDVSSGFFEKAQEKFRSWRDIMEFKTFNAEKEPGGQGFEPGSYDFVVAGNVVHATADLRKTLSNLRSLLKPGGKLILQEGTRQDFLWSAVSFGQLPGWWMGIEPERKWNPWISIDEWDRAFRDAGMSGVDLNLPDRADPSQTSQSILVGSALAEKSLPPEKVILVKAKTASKVLEGLADDLKDKLTQKLGVKDVSIVQHLDVAHADLLNSTCISLLEFEHPVLENLTEDEYINVRQLLALCDGLLWVTGDTDEHPQLDMITGLIRTVRWERDVDEANLIPLSISEPHPPIADVVEKIITMFNHQFVTKIPSRANAEYRLEDSTFLSNRLVDAETANDYLASKYLRPTPQMIPLGKACRPVKLTTASPGLLNKLEFVTDTRYPTPLGETEVEIEIKAVGLNFRDLMIAMGEHMAYSMGNEAAGVISRAGKAVNSLKVGDRVVYMCGLEDTGCFHTFGRVDQNVVVKVPDSMSYEIAAGLPCVYSTVIYGLFDAARLEKGETILIHAAAGGVGQAAIHISKSVGAEIYATVSSPEKRELLMKEFGIPEDHIFSSRDLSFVKGIMRMTKGHGVDVILNSLSGEALRRSWDCIAPFGRFVEIGKKDAQMNGRVELRPFLRNVTMTSVELPTMMRYRPELIGRLIADTIRLYEEGKIKEAVPTKVLNYTQIEEALRQLQSGKGMGKMVFVPREEDIVPIVPEELPPYRFEENAMYVLAGGLGGLGRSIALWMAERGAKHLVFFSRSKNLTAAGSEMVTKLETMGCKAHIFECDVTNKARLIEVVQECKASLPAVKGCIQGSMKLVDGMFENMSYDDFEAAIRPKVQGSWNLHECLPATMDFFLLLSSATGILGNRAQANYASGGTYQDALARHRMSNGLPAASVDLGAVLSVGYVAENKERTNMTKHLAAVLEVLREDEIHSLVEFLIDPRYPRAVENCQLVSGLTSAALYRQRGVPAPTYVGYPLFTHLNTISASAIASSGADGDSTSVFALAALLSTSTSLDDAAATITTAIRTKLSKLLALPIDNINPAKSVSSNGVDSLVAMEFRTWLAKDLGCDVPVLDIMGTSTIEQLGKKVASGSKLVQVAEGKTAGVPKE